MLPKITQQVKNWRYKPHTDKTRVAMKNNKTKVFIVVVVE